MTLTQKQHSVLCAVKDWTAPFEVAKALYPRGPSITCRKSVATALREVHAAGLADLHAGNNTYRINDAGRAALAGS